MFRHQPKAQVILQDPNLYEGLGGRGGGGNRNGPRLPSKLISEILSDPTGRLGEMVGSRLGVNGSTAFAEMAGIDPASWFGANMAYGAGDVAAGIPGLTWEPGVEAGGMAGALGGEQLAGLNYLMTPGNGFGGGAVGPMSVGVNSSTAGLGAPAFNPASLGIMAGIAAAIKWSANRDAKKERNAFKRFMESRGEAVDIGGDNQLYYNPETQRAYYQGRTPRFGGQGTLEHYLRQSLFDNPYTGYAQHTGRLGYDTGLLTGDQQGIVEFKDVDDIDAFQNYIQNTYLPNVDYANRIYDEASRIDDRQDRLNFLGNNPPPGYDDYTWYINEGKNEDTLVKVYEGEEPPPNTRKAYGYENPDLIEYYWGKTEADRNVSDNDRLVRELGLGA